ncbi:hypothetical protein QUF76_16595 [Desulfobacterales bacterium HSG16]|nr:hypothetical protein [Desulfobacterales bacterium HSG16]
MKTFELHDKVMEEIRLIPENRLSEIYNLIHFFRLGLETDRKNTKKTMRFAGCWQDMPDREFREFSEEISQRRRQAFSGRKSRETFAD